MMAEKSRFTRLADSLATYLRDSGLGERVAEAAVVPEWAERVGPAIAAVTTPLSVSHGTLLVAVRSSAWLMELHLMEREIVRRLNEGRARAPIRRIRFVQAETGEEPGSGERPVRRGRRGWRPGRARGSVPEEPDHGRK
jgi:predicted nucleic acid-binding Zn ribbon protein